MLLNSWDLSGEKTGRGKGNHRGLVRGERKKKTPVTERLCRLGLRREERGRSARDEQQLFDILFVPPPLAAAPSRLHYNSFSVRVKVRPDSSAAVYGYVCFCVCVLTCCVSQRPYKADGGKDGNEQSQTERTERFMGKKYSLCFCQCDRAAPRGLGERLGLIPGAWPEV